VAAVSLAERIRASFERRRTQHWLRGCERVGADPEIVGQPTIGSAGRIIIGDRFHLDSLPAPSHIATGAEGIVEIGDDVRVAHGAGLSATVRISIGSGTRIGPFAFILDTDFHVIGDRTGKPDATPIVIGRDVRIGSHVTVLRGSVIGDGASVAPGAVVSGSIPAGARVAGVPARLVAERGEADVSQRVPEVVMASFGLSEVPSPEVQRLEIPQWDSLGALRLLLTLEEAFDVALNEDEVVRVGTVADLTTLVDRAMARASESSEASRP
jgi:acetyltransferase-like isoleucine patch superfamily enzyme